MTRRTFLTRAAALTVGAFAAGCGEAAAPASAPIAPGTPQGAKKRVLVAYYSWSGNTKALAGLLAKATGGKLFALTPKEPYPTDYGACLERAKREIGAKARPELAALPELAEADVVLVGSPNWYGTLAPPVSAFLENAGLLAGKSVALFQTHGGGGAQRCERDFKAQCKGKPFGRALIVSGSRAARSGEEAAAWVRTLGL